MEKMEAINGNILKWARECCNIPLLAVAEKLKKDPQIIADWEQGLDFPTYAQLENLGELYNKPLAVFFFSDIPQIKALKSSLRTLPESVSNSLSYRIIRKMNDARTMQINLYELNDNSNPAFQSLFETRFSKNIKEMAAELRRILDIPLREQKRRRKDDDALEMWRGRFVRNGIYVFKDAFRDDSVSGFCLFDEVFPVIYLNNSMSFTRQIFTLFHEFYHLISHTSGIDKTEDDYFSMLSKDQLNIEQTCNQFAGEFLVPDGDFNAEIYQKDISDSLVNNLAGKYNVSREVIMRKLLDRRLISKEEYEQKRDDYIGEAVRARGQRSGGDYFNTKISYLGYDYLRLAFSKYTTQQIDIFALSQYTHTKVEHLPKLEQSWGWRG